MPFSTNKEKSYYRIKFMMITALEMRVTQFNKDHIKSPKQTQTKVKTERVLLY